MRGELVRWTLAVRATLEQRTRTRVRSTSRRSDGRPRGGGERQDRRPRLGKAAASGQCVLTVGVLVVHPRVLGCDVT